MKRSRSVQLTLVTAMPAMLAACSNDASYARQYTRTLYGTQVLCVRAFPTIQNACTYSGSGSSYYGPYTRRAGSVFHYLPYLPGGKVSTRGITYDPAKRAYGAFNDSRAANALSSGSTARGGFGSTPKSRSSFGG